MKSLCIAISMLCSIFDDVYSKFNYVSDIEQYGMEYKVSSAHAVKNNQDFRGDCDDFASRFSAVKLGLLCTDLLGYFDLRRFVWVVLYAVFAVHSLPADHRYLRGEGGIAAGRSAPL